MSGLKKEVMPGTHLVVDDIEVLGDSQTSKNVTELQTTSVKLYFAERKLKEVQTLLDDMADDSVITPAEKIDLQEKMNILAVDHSILIQSAQNNGLDGDQVYADYNTAYNTLLAYINPMLSMPAVNSPIDPTLYRNTWNSYWIARAALESLIDDAIEANSITKQEIYEGYDLTIDEEVVATTTPIAPVLYGSSTKRNIYLSWERQKNLTGQHIQYEIQCSSIAFASDDLAIGYSIGSGGDEADDWQGVAGAVTVVFGNSISINDFPLSEGAGGPAAKTYFFRARCRQSNENVSTWGHVAVTVAPITAKDLASDTVTDQIEQLQDKVTVGEYGYLGANYSVSDTDHVFTTADQRIYMDSDELTLQKVTSVSAENEPTWSDVMKLGGLKRALFLKELGQRIGLDLDGSNEYSIAFAKDLTDYSSYPFGTTASRFLDLCADSGIGFSNPDSNKLIGYINTANKTFHWDGILHTGEKPNMGISFPIIEKSLISTPAYPSYHKNYIDSGLLEAGPINACQEEYIGAQPTWKTGIPDGSFAGKDYYCYKPEYAANALLLSTTSIDTSGRGSHGQYNYYSVIEKYSSSIKHNLDLKFRAGTLDDGTRDSGQSGMRAKITLDSSEVAITTWLSMLSYGTDGTYSTGKDFVIPASEQKTTIYTGELPDGIYRIALCVSFAVHNYGKTFDTNIVDTVTGETIPRYVDGTSEVIMRSIFYLIDENDTVYGSSNIINHHIPDISIYDPTTGVCLEDATYYPHPTYITSSSFIDEWAAYHDPGYEIDGEFSNFHLLNIYRNLRFGNFSKDIPYNCYGTELYEYPSNYIAPGEFTKDYFSVVSEKDNIILPNGNGKTSIGSPMQTVQAIGASGPKGEPGETGPQGPQGETGNQGGAWIPGTYLTNQITTHNGKIWRVTANPSTIDEPSESSNNWRSFIQDSTLLSYQKDSTIRSFSTTPTVGWVTDSISARAEEIINIDIGIPCRNDSSSWGGAYIGLEYELNESGTWLSLGDSGYDGSVMHSASPSISTYTNSLVMDFSASSTEFAPQMSDFSIKFRFSIRSYDGTVTINGSHNIDAIWNASQNTGLGYAWSHIIVTSLNRAIQGPAGINGIDGIQGERGPAGDGFLGDDLPIGTILMYDAQSPAEIDGITVSFGRSGPWVDNLSLPGWYACVAGNQDKGCPNLVSRFVMGKIVSGIGNIGGVNAITLTESNLPSHNHSIDHDHPAKSSGTVSAGHQHYFTEYFGYLNAEYDSTNQQAGHAANTSARRLTEGITVNHTHTTDLDLYFGISGDIGNDLPFDNRPAHYSIIYIRKCS